MPTDYLFKLLLCVFCVRLSTVSYQEMRNIACIIYSIVHVIKLNHNHVIHACMK